MKLREYIRLLNALVKENPKALDMDVVYAIDDEGNNFSTVHYGAGVGKFEEEYGDFDPDQEPNAVCLN